MSDVVERRPIDAETNDGAAPVDGDLWDQGGEFISIPEAIVVSPASGRFRREKLIEGASIQVGTVIGQVAFNGARSLPVMSQVVGVFLGWLAWEGESLQRGAPLAHIGLNGIGGDGSVVRNGSDTKSQNPNGASSTNGSEEESS